MKEETNDIMALRIKALRKQKNLSQEQLADLLGLQKSAIAKYENGRVINIKRSTIAKMAKIFNCSPSYIMGCLSAERRCIRRRTTYSAAGSVGDYSMLYHLPAEQYRADYQVCRKFVFPFRGNLL